MNKTGSMCVNERETGKVNMQGEEIVKVDQFKYLGSTMLSNKQHTREVRQGGVGGDKCQG